MILHMEDVIKRFGNHLALDHLSLEVKKGEVVGLLGATDYQWSGIEKFLWRKENNLADTTRKRYFGTNRNWIEQ